MPWSLLSLYALLAVGLLAALWREVRDSLLVYAWGWTCLAAVAVGGVELWVVLGMTTSGAAEAAPSWLGPTRYAAACLLFCPLMSVLGSKRPHEQAWQWIVLSLWGILVLPAVEFLLVRRGATLEIHGVRSWFLLGLIFLTATHGIGTRGFPAGGLLALAQTLLLRHHLPGLARWLEAEHHQPLSDSAITHVAVLLLIATLSWLLTLPRWHRHAPPQDRVWLDFRDAFGTLWALRIRERFNDAASAGSWDLRLAWLGFRRRIGTTTESPATDPCAILDERAAQAFWNLARRFVTPAWCLRRGWTPPAGSVIE
ncbi:MAG: hypothetical protein U0935_23020 [Pirellulales bacterium]